MKNSIVALLTLSSFGAAAQAQPILVDASVSTRSYVHVADLDIGAAAGRETAARRIRGAASELCANDGDRSVASRIAAHNCFRGAVEGGLTQLGTASASLPTAIRGL